MQHLIFFSTILVFLALQPAQSENLYRSVDENGKVTYSSKKPHPNAKPAVLPEIMKGDVKLAPDGLYSCEDHGGINCQAGTDDDGSVICYDGFRGSVARFVFHCSEAKVEISEVKRSEEGFGWEVVVRNSRSIEAKNTQVLFEPREGDHITLQGPESIEPFGVGVFRFPVGDFVLPQDIEVSRLMASCSNCLG